jgi:DegV family protein with EDD domain
MSFKIIGDSCLDLTSEMKRDSRFQIVPLTLQVDDWMVVDDEHFNQLEFIDRVKKSPNCPKSACPSPEAFKKACECEEDDVFVITLSSHLSGSYNSARLGRELYVEEHGEKNILVIDSESASAGETQLASAIISMYEQGMDFAQVSEAILRMRDEQRTYFVIDSLEPLRKNGRLTGLQAFFATALNIKPVMGAEHGVIVKLDQARGLNKAFARMSEIGIRCAGETEKMRVTIAHCNCLERAKQVKAELEKRAKFLEIVITETAGVATLYAGDGGIVMAIG